MLTKDAFVEFILKGAAAKTAGASAGATRSALPEGFEEFEIGGTEHTSTDDTTFARRLLEAADFGLPELVARDSVIRSTDSVAQHLPDRVAYWPKTPSRPYQTLLFESTLKSDDLLRISAFRHTQLHHLNDVEAALARLVSQALDGFQRGGESVTADVRKGRANETLCVISILDTRDVEPVRLVCFGTENASSKGLETFSINEGTRFWDVQLAREHLGLLYERQFRKLAGKDWQEAFTTSEERGLAETLLRVCTRKAPKEQDILEAILDLLDTIAKGFGLRKRPNSARRLQAFALPADHDIGIDPEEREKKFSGKNPFAGVTLRDDRSRLLGYIVYPLATSTDAARLRRHLEEYNRFHNVLVVYPDHDQTRLELWQGREQLTGKLRQEHGYKDAADVVNLLSRFFVVSKARVRNPAELAQELAYRARYLRRLAVRQLGEESKDGPLRRLYAAFTQALVHDQTELEFADAFAQTVTYGLLTARWTGNDKLVLAGERLTRQTALKYLPPSSPFLNELFESVLSLKLDEQRGRLLWLVDDIADLLDRIDVTYVFGAGDAGSDVATDPVIHFYEPFLGAYDRELKNKRGVFFTPRPVVTFIVRSAHELLRSSFGLEDGLASTATWAEVTASRSDIGLPPGVKPSDPFVRLLDLATGTGTFLYEAIGFVEHSMKDRWCRELGTSSWDHPEIRDRWNKYVPAHLLPRLTGYEIMMAPYSIAHLKLSLKLAETGYQWRRSDRIQVYLTNTLEPAADIQPGLSGIAPALADEAVAVNRQKRLGGYTVVVGNPPYSNFGGLNRNAFILELLEDYKRHLDERKINLDDDFIKFFRFGHHLLQRVNAGVLALITNNAYLDGITHRRMRESLMKDFAHIRVVDLHGNARRAEVAPDGSPDENVFDIMQGVAIGVFATHRSLQPDISIAHLQGSRLSKYEALGTGGLLHFDEISPTAPYFLFGRRFTEESQEYESGVALPEVFRLYQSPIQTKRDALTIQVTKNELSLILADLRTKPVRLLREKYELAPDGRDWTLPSAIDDVKNDRGKVIRIQYKPFDYRYTYFSGKTKGFLAYPRTAVMRHMLRPDARAFVFKRQGREDSCGYTYFFVTDCPFSEGLFAIDPRGREFIAPMELIADDSDDTPGQRRLRSPAAGDTLSHNFSQQFLQRLSAALALPQDESGLPHGIVARDVFNYIYATVSSPLYRKRFEASLRIDFPRVPLPADMQVFAALAALGRKLVSLHVLDTKEVPAELRCKWVGHTPMLVERVVYEDGAIWLDRRRTQGCVGVPPEVWTYYVGGYQVCDKWLKQRKGRELRDRDLEHFELVANALSASTKVTAEIDRVIEHRGGWPGAFAVTAAVDVSV